MTFILWYLWTGTVVYYSKVIYKGRGLTPLAQAWFTITWVRILPKLLTTR